MWFGHYKVTKNIANVLIIKQLFLINFHRTHVKYLNGDVYTFYKKIPRKK